MRILSVTLLFAASALALVGCKPGDTATTGNDPPAVAPVAVDVTEVRVEQLEAAVKANKGNVVLVDFWATWCGPCVKKFPHFVETHKKYRDKGLVTMSVSLDPQGRAKAYRDEKGRDKVLAFLKEKGATFPNFIAADPDADSEKIEKAFGWEGVIPLMVLFDKSGKRVWTSYEWEEKDWPDEKIDAELDTLIEAELVK